MATKKQNLKFISEIAPCAVKAYKTLGKVKPSVCIGMACVESAWGTAGSCKYHSYLGHKVGTGKTATKYWGGRFFVSKTQEEYTVGVHTTIKAAAFRTFDSMEQCVFNFYELMNTKLYAKVLSEADYRIQMRQIKACGYMTSSTEVNSVLSIIEKYDLTQYDNEADNIGNVKYEKGRNYELQANMNVRKEPNGEKIALLSKGTVITCRDVQTDCKGNTWVKCPSGWICGMSANGRVYLS